MKYYSVEIIEGTHYSAHTNMITGTESGFLYSSIIEWMAENIEGSFKLIVDNHKQGGVLLFNNKDDALAFKMRWL